MGDKEFKTLDEQIEILESRGLSIQDKNLAKSFLLKNNYYRISGYSLTLRSYDVFYKGTTFQNIMDIYYCDHEFRHILLKHIETIEVIVKSVYAYEFTKRHGATGYRQSSFFTSDEEYNKITAKADKLRDDLLPHEAYIKHFVVDLKQEIPLWAYVDLLTIHDISMLYKISQPDVQEAVASDLGLVTCGVDLLKSFMHSLTIIRNLCAHGSRLFNRLFEQMPWLKRKEIKLLAKNVDGTVDNSHLFGFILIMRRLLPHDDFLELKDEVASLFQKYSFVNPRHYGFPADWNEKI